jgi:predicted transcriptional regulator
MSKTHLRRNPVDHSPSERKDLTVTAGAPNDILGALASETAQAILGALQDDCKPVSEISDAVGTSLQNTLYHVERLVEVGLVEPVDVWYSPKGQEMSVYALTAEELRVQFGSRDG